MRILITGSRNWTNRRVIECALSALGYYRPEPIIIVHGGAEGADKLADMWARGFGFKVEIWKPEYDKYPGNIAPLKRNDAMLDSGIDLVLAFMLGTPQKGGTLYTVNGAKQRGIPVIIHNWESNADFKG